MIPFFGILRPTAGPTVASAEAPFKASFFGGPLDATAPTAMEDALYLNGKQPAPAERNTNRPRQKQ